MDIHLNTRYEMGHTTRGNIATTRRLTEGSMFESMYIILGKIYTQDTQRNIKKKDYEKRVT